MPSFKVTWQSFPLHTIMWCDLHSPLTRVDSPFSYKANGEGTHPLAPHVLVRVSTLLNYPELSYSTLSPKNSSSSLLLNKAHVSDLLCRLDWFCQKKGNGKGESSFLGSFIFFTVSVFKDFCPSLVYSIVVAVVVVVARTGGTIFICFIDVCMYVCMSNI